MNDFKVRIKSKRNLHPQLTLTRPLRRKLRMRWFFDVSKVKDSTFLDRISLTPPQILDAHLMENTNLSSSSVHFSVDFYIKIMFSVRWFYN